jgi:ATP:cob(I)alamin adenosyltransferase
LVFQADGVGGGFDGAHIDELEEWIDVMTEQFPELSSFILPTGSKAAAQFHVARTVCRRAERYFLRHSCMMHNDSTSKSVVT